MFIPAIVQLELGEICIEREEKLKQKPTEYESGDLGGLSVI